jgi:Flp pilus assembly protein TadG
MRYRVARRPPHRQGDRGAVTVEIIGFFFPMMLLSITVVAAGLNLSVSRLDLESASAAAARAASLQRNPAAATTAAHQAAASNLDGRAITCADLVVQTDTSQFRRGGTVTVTVTCTVRLADLARLNDAIPGSVQASSTSRAPIDTYRRVETP